MRLPFGIYNLINPEEYIWLKIRILKETAKAILITSPFVIASKTKQSQNDDIKFWIPKSRIYRIKLRNNIFEIYVKEGTVG